MIHMINLLISILILPSILFFDVRDSSAFPKNKKSLKVLIITGGHGFEREAFFEMFKSYENITYQEVKHPMANQYLSEQLARYFDVLVFYDMYNKISEEEKSNFLKLCRNGKAMVFLHHSLVSYQHWPEFQQIIGGKYHQKASDEHAASTYKHDVNIQVKVAQPNHPILKGINDFEIFDEVYGNFSVNQEVIPLLTTDHPESSKNIAWINEYEHSKIVYIQLGHDHHAYENTTYRKLLQQAIWWAYQANRPIPKVNQ